MSGGVRSDLPATVQGFRVFLAEGNSGLGGAIILGGTFSLCRACTARGLAAGSMPRCLAAPRRRRERNPGTTWTLSLSFSRHFPPEIHRFWQSRGTRANTTSLPRTRLSLVPGSSPPQRVIHVTSRALLLCTCKSCRASVWQDIHRAALYRGPCHPSAPVAESTV